MPTGKDGAVAIAAGGGIGTLTLRIISYNYTADNPLHDSTAFGDSSGWTTSEPDIPTLTGSAEGLSASGLNVPAAFIAGGAAGLITLTSASGRTCAFQARISSFGERVQKVGALNSFTFSFRSEGAVTWA